jgi:hypothetical protein
VCTSSGIRDSAGRTLGILRCSSRHTACQYVSSSLVLVLLSVANQYPSLLHLPARSTPARRTTPTYPSTPCWPHCTPLYTLAPSTHHLHTNTYTHPHGHPLYFHCHTPVRLASDTYIHPLHPAPIRLYLNQHIELVARLLVRSLALAFLPGNFHRLAPGETNLPRTAQSCQRGSLLVPSTFYLARCAPFSRRASTTPAHRTGQQTTCLASPSTANAAPARTIRWRHLS